MRSLIAVAARSLSVLRSCGAILLLVASARALLAQGTLSVSHVSPAGMLRATARIDITFSAPLAEQVEQLGTAASMVRLEPAIAASITWRDPATLRITPDSALMPGTSLRVVVDTFSLPDGTRLSERWTRTWQVQPPTITATLPTLGNTAAAGLGFDARILLRVRGIPDTAAMVAGSAFVATRGSCSEFGASRRVGVRVTVRMPRGTDPYPIRLYLTPRDSIDARFDRVVEITPAQPLPEDCALDLVLTGTTLLDGVSTSARYPVRTTAPARVSFGCSFDGDCSEGVVEMRATAAIDYPTLRRAVRMEPAAAITFPDSAGPRTVWPFRHRLAPGDTLRATLTDEFRDVHGRSIAAAAPLVIPNRLARWNTRDGVTVLPRGGPSVLPVHHAGIDSVRVTVFRDPNDPLAVLAEPRGFHADSSITWRDSITYTVSLGRDRNAERETEIPLRFPDVRWTTGLLGVRLVAVGYTRHLFARPEVLGFAVQHSDLAAHTSVQANGGAVFVTDARGRPLPDVEIRALGESGRRLAQVHSDRNGLARVDVAAHPGTAPDGTWPYAEIVALELRRGNDRLLAGVGANRAAYRRGRATGQGADEPRFQHATVISDRDLYRPGERIYASAIVRDGWSDALRAVRSERVRWRLVPLAGFDDEGEAVVTREGRLSDVGMAADSFPLPADAILGNYHLALDRRHGDRWVETANRLLSVREFRAQELSVSLAFDRTDLVRDDALRATLSARLLLDAPLGDARVDWSLLRSAHTSTEPVDAGLRPGWSDADAFSDGRPDSRDALRSGTARTDSSGTLRLSWPTDSLPPSSGTRFDLVATVRDVTGQTVSRSASTVVRGSIRRIALRGPGGWGVSIGRPITVRFGVVDREGRWLDRQPVHVLVLHRREETRVVDGEPRSVQWLDTLHRESMASRDSSGVFVFTPRAGMEFGIVFEGVDEDGAVIRSSTHHYAIPSNPRSDSASFPFALGSDSANVGETLSLQFESPWEDAEAWVLVARDRPITQQRVRARRGANVMRLPVDTRWIPEATVSVMLVRRGAPTSAARDFERYRIQSARIRVGAESKRLSVRVLSRAREHRPGGRATLDLDVRDATGRPVAGEVVVWAVDEGVLALTDFNAPDPLRELLTQREWRHPTLASTLSFARVVMERSAAGMAFRQGFSSELRLEQVVVAGVTNEDFLGRGVSKSAGARIDPAIRSDFRTTAFYRSGVRVGADGRATVQVALPDGITTYRVMAIAVDARDRAGVGESRLVVTKPLLARAALPRFVRPADRFAAGVAVNTRGLEGPVPVRVTASATGSASLTADSTQQVTVDPSGRRVRFDASIARGDAAQFAFTVASDTLGDGLVVELPQREDQVPLARADVTVVRDSTTLRLALPRDVDALRSTIELRVGATPLPVLQSWAQWLDGERSDFSYAVFYTARGLLAMRQLQIRGALGGADSAQLHRRLDVALSTLAARLDAQGRVRLWPGSPLTDDAFDAAVGTLMLEARAVGARVPQHVLTLLASRVTQALRARRVLPDTTYGDAQQRRVLMARHLSTRLSMLAFVADARAVESLRPFVSETGDSLSAMIEAAPQMTFEDRARLARLLPPGASATRLLNDLWTHAQRRGERVDIADSVVRLDGGPDRIAPFARLLQATRRHQPDHPLIGALAQRIIQQARAGTAVWSARDYADAVEAIAGFMAEIDGRDATVHIRDDSGRVLLRLEPGEATTRTTHRLDEVARSTDSLGTIPLSVVAQGGSVYLTATTRVLRRERPVAPRADGVRVERWYERIRDGRTVTEVEEGELVRVHLRVTADAAREFLVIEDPLPAGLEVVDPHHRGTGAQQARMMEAARSSTPESDASDSAPFVWWRWNPWDHVELRDDRVVVYSRGLPAGTHRYSYLTRATTAGRFVRPQTTAREFFNPALEGASEGGWFTVNARPPR